MKDKVKTHYRKVFKSDHLGVADLEEFLEEGKGLVFTIKEVKQEIGVSVAGRKGNHNIAYFNEDIKPLVLNATNSKRVKVFCNNSPFVEDWSNTTIELYIDKGVKMKGDIVGGVRIKTKQPKTGEKAKTGIGPKRFGDALKAIKDGNFTKTELLAKFILTTEQEEQLNG
jgi:hypothetical protein